MATDVHPGTTSCTSKHPSCKGATNSAKRSSFSNIKNSDSGDSRKAAKTQHSDSPGPVSRDRCSSLQPVADLVNGKIVHTLQQCRTATAHPEEPDRGSNRAVGAPGYKESFNSGAAPGNASDVRNDDSSRDRRASGAPKSVVVKPSSHVDEAGVQGHRTSVLRQPVSSSTGPTNGAAQSKARKESGHKEGLKGSNGRIGSNGGKKTDDRRRASQNGSAKDVHEGGSKRRVAEDCIRQQKVSSAALLLKEGTDGPANTYNNKQGDKVGLPSSDRAMKAKEDVVRNDKATHDCRGNETSRDKAREVRDKGSDKKMDEGRRAQSHEHEHEKSRGKGREASKDSGNKKNEGQHRDKRRSRDQSPHRGIKEVGKAGGEENATKRSHKQKDKGHRDERPVSDNQKEKKEKRSRSRSRSRSHEKKTALKRESTLKEKDRSRDHKGNHYTRKRQISPASGSRLLKKSQTGSPRSRPRFPVSPRSLDRFRLPQGRGRQNGRVTGFDNPHRPLDVPGAGGWDPHAVAPWNGRRRSPSPPARPRSTSHIRARSPVGPPRPRGFEEGRGWNPDVRLAAGYGAPPGPPPQPSRPWSGSSWPMSAWPVRDEGPEREAWDQRGRRRSEPNGHHMDTARWAARAGWDNLGVGQDTRGLYGGVQLPPPPPPPNGKSFHELPMPPVYNGHGVLPPPPGHPPADSPDAALRSSGNSTSRASLQGLETGFREGDFVIMDEVIEAQRQGLPNLLKQTGPDEPCWFYLDPEGRQQKHCSINMFLEWTHAMSEHPDKYRSDYVEFMKVYVWKDRMNYRVRLSTLLHLARSIT
eukprot:jgi/Botrbrau1/7972/Bobra.9_2s0123.1